MEIGKIKLNSRQIVESWDLRRQILELLMLDIRYFGTDKDGKYIPQVKLSNEIIQFLEHYPIGGIILFQENLATPEQIVNLTHKLQQSSQFGRLIAVDSEGGVVTRCGTDTPGNMALGAINDINMTTKAASIIGSELHSLGVNLNFAPVLDVNSNSDNPIIGVRAFADNPESVAKHGAAFIQGLKQHNIIPCAKHFPGHGDTSSDSHLDTAYAKHSLLELEKIELFPFRQLIDQGIIDAIMIAHIVVPNLDNNLVYATKKQANIAIPATLSKIILTDVLRSKMHFTGLIITDAMDMQAITDNFDAATATLLSLKAGCDVILMPVRIWDSLGIKQFIQYFDEVYTACLLDDELCERIKQSCIRLLGLKLKNKNQAKDYENSVLVEKIRRAKLTVGDKEHIDYQHILAKKAITLHKNENEYLPFKLNKNDKILIIANNENLIRMTTNIIKDIIKHITDPSIENHALGITLDNWLLNYSMIDDNTKFNRVEGFNKIIVLTYNLTCNDKGINLLFKTLNLLGIPYVMLSCRNPYDIKYASLATTNVLAYGATGFDQTSYKIKEFSLNLYNALLLIFNAKSASEFNTYCPVALN